MRKFKITGIDRDSGFETTIIVEAKDRPAAVAEAEKRGVSAQRCEEVVADELAAVGHERPAQAVAGMSSASPWSRRRRAAGDGESSDASDAPPPPDEPPAQVTPLYPPQPFQPYQPDFIMPPPLYWKKLKDTIASGVFWGLMTWFLFWIIVPAVVIFVLFLVGSIAM
ncbi:MAG: hypothetical protein IT430_03920 [Phycisphaerales bacterium]|nr:hypothetical protein [Phycisphaerales bacterium]